MRPILLTPIWPTPARLAACWWNEAKCPEDSARALQQQEIGRKRSGEILLAHGARVFRASGINEKSLEN